MRQTITLMLVLFISYQTEAQEPNLPADTHWISAAAAADSALGTTGIFSVKDNAPANRCSC
jgi:hypothetical protein